MSAVVKEREFLNFDSQDYDFVLSFNNGEREISLNSHILVELEIEENLLNWFITGYVILDNPFDNFERLPDFSEHAKFAGNPELDYKYRGDGRDMMRIKIIPRIQSVADNTLGEAPKLKTEIWEIYFEAVIYDIEEIPSENPQTKRKKFYFREKEYQIMSEKNIEFTTANVGKNKNNTDIINLNNDQRSLPTGEALLELFKSVEELKNKVPEEATIENNWNPGSERNSIFYTSPSNFKVLDDVEYILDSHTSGEEDDFDLCFLRFNRRIESQPKKFSLESLKSIFKKAGTSAAGEYQLERFVLMDLNESKKTIPIPKTPQDSPSFEKNIMVLTRNEINSYQFSEMAGGDSSELIQIFPVHSYEMEGGQFNIHFKNNTPKKAKDFQKENYTPNIGIKSEPRLQLNNWKLNGYNLLNLHGYRITGKESRYTLGRNQLLMYSLLNGTTISFSCKGQTSRQTGRFFSIEKNKYNDTDFDDRLEGQYLFTVVKHKFDFKTQNYTNSILGVKLHRFGSSRGNLPEDDTKLLS